jgi:DNA-binding NarL/FixJ family response regulator
MDKTARILIIDDERFLSLSLVSILEQAHYAAVSTLSSAAGLASLRASQYDLVIQDIQLRDMEGLDLLRQIQKISPKIKVLILTTDFSETRIRSAYQAGASDYLIKPVEPKALLQDIDDLLHGRSLASIVQ